MLVKEAEILDASGTPFLGDIRIHENHVTEVGRLTAKIGETVVNARRNLIVPGLNDHHGHLIAFAASLRWNQHESASMLRLTALVSCQ